eukprot:COSAG06_NODE_16311_length_1008_cov_0.552255_2_plen_239_part_01
MTLIFGFVLVCVPLLWVIYSRLPTGAYWRLRFGSDTDPTPPRRRFTGQPPDNMRQVLDNMRQVQAKNRRDLVAYATDKPRQLPQPDCFLFMPQLDCSVRPSPSCVPYSKTMAVVAVMGMITHLAAAWAPLWFLHGSGAPDQLLPLVLLWPVRKICDTASLASPPGFACIWAAITVTSHCLTSLVWLTGSTLYLMVQAVIEIAGSTCKRCYEYTPSRARSPWCLLPSAVVVGIALWWDWT